jgi:uncharacterized protein YihD (DUF1040 family)
MRDAERIERILLKIQEVWEQNPDLRLMQLIINAARPKDPCSELYSLDDSQLEKRLDRLIDGMR